MAEEQTIPAALYAKRADKLCRALGVDVQELRTQARLRSAQHQSASEREAMTRSADILGEQLDVIATFRRKFEALGMPAEHGDDAQRLLDKTRSAEGELEQAVAALRAADEQSGGRGFAALFRLLAAVSDDCTRFRVELRGLRRRRVAMRQVRAG